MNGMGSSSSLKRELEVFKSATGIISDKINGINEFWNDNVYSSLQTSIRELAKNSKSVIESGDKACASIDRFFAIAAEDVGEVKDIA